jgi:phenylacetate-CoA ligase
MILKTIINKYRFYKATGQQIEKLQLKKINYLFSTAKKFSKYYRKIFSEFGISSIKSFKDFERIPYLDRDVLINNQEDIKIEKFACYDVKTSGSSGEPVTINRSKKSILRTLITGHPFFISKYLGSKIKSICLILIWGEDSIEDIFEGNISRYLKLSKTSLSVLSPINEIVDVLITKKPELILTYPSFLVNLRQYLQKGNIKLDFLKLIIVSGELISPYFTDKNKKFFNCPILNAYISTEGGLMGIDHTDREGMYLMADNAYLEVIKNGKPVLDEEGNIVITELNNFATPLIRYKGLRDRGIISLGNNGKRYLKLVSGRIMDDLITKNNYRICAYAITEIIESFKEVLKFKIIQESNESIKIFVDISGNKNLFRKSEKYYTEIKKEIERIFKHPVKLEIITGKKIKDMFESVPFRVLERKF